MPRWVFSRLGPALFVAVAVIATACSSSSSSAGASGVCDTSASPRFINFVAYSTPREVYDAKILPAFVKLWKSEHDQTIQFTESYAGSTTQALLRGARIPLFLHG